MMQQDKRQFSLGWWMGVILGVSSSAFIVYGASVNLPHIFQAKTMASAAQVNDNFTALAEAINDHALRFACVGEMVDTGVFCIDRYEASVWKTTNVELIAKILSGTVNVSELQALAVQVGEGADTYGQDCPNTGNGCRDYYAVSLPDIKPSTNLTWFQAAAICRNAQKRLPTNQEWQVMALGTPESDTDDAATTCNITAKEDGAVQVVATGSRTACQSEFEVFDMIGNVWELTADWVQGNSGIAPSAIDATIITTADFGSDAVIGVIKARADANNLPGVILRGGSSLEGTGAGVFAVSFDSGPSQQHGDNVGFRCAK